MTNEASTSDPLQQAADGFMRAVSAMPLSTRGKIAELLDHVPEKQRKGLNFAMRSLGEAIGEYQDFSQLIGNNKELVDRLREVCEKKVLDGAGFEKDGYNPMDALLPVAFPGEKGITHVAQEKLREAFKHNGRSIFDEIVRALKGIMDDHGLQAEDHLHTHIHDDGKGPKTPKKDEGGGWHDSVKGDEPSVGDKTIRDAARDYDKDTPTASDREITKSAAGGDKEFRPTDEHRTPYEREESRGTGDIQYYEDISQKHQNIRMYYQLARDLRDVFDRTLGTCLEPAGMVPGGKK